MIVRPNLNLALLLALILNLVPVPILSLSAEIHSVELALCNQIVFIEKIDGHDTSRLPVNDFNGVPIVPLGALATSFGWVAFYNCVSPSDGKLGVHFTESSNVSFENCLFDLKDQFTSSHI